MGKKKKKYEVLSNLLSTISGKDDFVLTVKEINDELIKHGYSLADTELKEGGISRKTSFNKAFLENDLIITKKNFIKNSGKKVLVSIEAKKDAKAAQRSRVNNEVKPSQIILNSIFPDSSYLNNSKNIGHEIINIFGADNDEYYYYLSPSGQFNYTPKIVLSISKMKNGLYKVINKAVVKRMLEGAYKDGNKGDTPKESYKKQIKKYKYNNHFIEEYLKKNIYNKRYNISTLATFECEGIYTPKYDIFISFGKSNVEQNKRRRVYKIESAGSARSLRVFNLKDDDQALLEEIADDKNWYPEKIPSFKDKYGEVKERVENHTDDLFKLLGIDSLEVPYSNFLGYILEKANIIDSFLHYVFKDKCALRQPNTFTIERETFNTDLLFTNFDKEAPIADEKIFIIENKIDASVTLSDREAKNIDGQIDKIYRIMHEIDEGAALPKKDQKIIQSIKKHVVERDKNLVSNEHSQLSKYYIYAVVLALMRKWGWDKINKDIKCAFLCPEYAKFQYSIKKKHLSGNGLILENEYLFITYKDLCNFFEKQEEKIKELNQSLQIKYSIFKSAIALKAKERDDSMESRMIERFYKII